MFPVVYYTSRTMQVTNYYPQQQQQQQSIVTLSPSQGAVWRMELNESTKEQKSEAVAKERKLQS